MTDSQPVQSTPPPASKEGSTNRLGNSIQSIGPMLVDTASAAILLGVSQRTLWSLTARRAIPSRKIGRSVRYSPAELDAWVGLGCPTEPNAANAVLAEVRRMGGGQ